VVQLFVVPSLHLQRNCCISLCLSSTVTSSSSTFKDPYEPPWLIQDNLSSQGQLISNLNSICNLNSPRHAQRILSSIFLLGHHQGSQSILISKFSLAPTINFQQLIITSSKNACSKELALPTFLFLFMFGISCQQSICLQTRVLNKNEKIFLIHMGLLMHALQKQTQQHSLELTDVPIHIACTKHLLSILLALSESHNSTK
jgi:hypothetical protein